MASLTRAALKSKADTNLADNTSGDISASDVRGSVDDLADSSVFPEDLAAVATSGSWDDLSGTPTTLSGYGITDSYTSSVIDDKLDGKANLSSPALTGIPTAPTASNTTSTTQLATTAFVQNAVANLINGAPSALDTLNELATALRDDANFASTVTNSLAKKLSLSGGTLTGKLVANSGISLNSRVASSETNLTDGIDLYSGLVGLNITGSRLNIVAPSDHVVNIVGGASLAVANNTVWHAGNFDPGDKLDVTAKAADSAKLNGQSASYYQRNLQDLHNVEFGSTLTGDRTVNIDFHADDTNNDRSFGIIRLGGKDGKALFQQFGAGNIDFLLSGSVTINSNEIWHAGNFDPDAALPKAGGTMSGGLSFGSSGVSSPEDTTRHITLYDSNQGGAYNFGFSVTQASLNINTVGQVNILGGKLKVAGTEVALVDGSNATGTWPINITGTAANALGVGQTWQDVTASRAAATAYQNTTGKPIGVAIVAANATFRNLQVSADGTSWITVGGVSGSNTLPSFTVVPEDWYYQVNGTTTITSWAELR